MKETQEEWTALETERFEGEGGDPRLQQNQPVIELLIDGRCSYLWVGNGAEDDQACFTTLSDRVALRKLARAILRELGER